MTIDSASVQPGQVFQTQAGKTYAVSVTNQQTGGSNAAPAATPTSGS